MMKEQLVAAAFCVALAWTSGATANSNSFSKTVPPGKPTRVAAYHSWDPTTCASLSATMNVQANPKHGTLVPHVTTTTIRTTRIGTGGVGQCYGHAIKALQIDYKPAPGYRGPDSFIIEVIFGYTERRDTDTYNITVE
jgi:hypothetical protein